MANYTRKTVKSATSIRAIADGANSFFFSPASMRFFKSRLLEVVYPASSNVNGSEARTGNAFYFLTSERFEDDPRHYTVRKMTLTTAEGDRPAVDIVTVGEYHDTEEEAREAARRAAR